MVSVEDDSREATRMFHWALQCQFWQFEKVPNFMVSLALSCHTLLTVHLICMQYSCFRNPLNYDTDYRIFNMPTRSFNACVYTHVCLYLFCKTKWLPFSLGGVRGGGGGAWGPLFHPGRPLGPLLWTSRSNTVFIIFWMILCSPVIWLLFQSKLFSMDCIDKF